MPTTRRSLRSRVPLIAALALLALALFAPQAMARYVYTGNYDDDNVSVIDTATNQVVGSPIPAGNGPWTMAITPNGKTLYVGSEVSEDITAIDTQTNQPVATIPLDFQPATIAISPDGNTAYVTSQNSSDVVVVDTQTNQKSGAPIALGAQPYGVAFSPDGKTTYVTREDEDDVVVIDIQTRQVAGSPIPVGDEPINVVFSADGKTAYVGNLDEATVSVIDTQTRQVVATIAVGDEPWGLGLTPDGTRLYVSNLADDTVSVIDTATRQVVGDPIPTGDEPFELAATPDGKAVYVANSSGEADGRGVTVIDTQSNQVTDVDVVGGPWQLAIVPDQAPTASVAATASKSNPLAIAFGATASDPDGSVAVFDWSFGDGTTALNGGPTPTHTYASAGTFTVGLTAIDNEGCSGFLYTGRTAFCNGPGPVAQSLTVNPPNNFKFGKLLRNKKKGTAKLKVKVPYAGKLTLTGKKVRKVKRSAKKAGPVVLNIRPKPKAKQQLIDEGSLKVRIKVTFKPTGGKARSKGRSVKLLQN